MSVADDCVEYKDVLQNVCADDQFEGKTVAWLPTAEASEP
jgi:hypothetical protein